jgi:hypothetical protein
MSSDLYEIRVAFPNIPQFEVRRLSRKDNIMISIWILLILVMAILSQSNPSDALYVIQTIISWAFCIHIFRSLNKDLLRLSLWNFLSLQIIFTIIWTFIIGVIYFGFQEWTSWVRSVNIVPILLVAYYIDCLPSLSYKVVLLGLSSIILFCFGRVVLVLLSTSVEICASNKCYSINDYFVSAYIGLCIQFMRKVVSIIMNPRIFSDMNLSCELHQIQVTELAMN